MRAPLFWKNKTTLSAILLPVSQLYFWLYAANQKRQRSEKVQAKVICVGNAVAGGAGKTPVALAIGALIKTIGKNAHYLSRGYKGNYTGVVRVDPEKHIAQEVGDEPLLLAEILPTWVARDKATGAKAAVAAGAEMIIMDDGFQNPSLHKDISLLVVDGHYGFGNERLIPSGPLREPIMQAMKKANAVILIGNDRHGVLKHVPQTIPVLHAEITLAGNMEFLKEKPVVAFCGIANPRKFYRALHLTGCLVRKHISYSDHHTFTAEDVALLRAMAAEHQAVLVTTEKDFVRLPEEIRSEVQVLPVEIVFKDKDALLGVLSA